ncbi:MAG: serine hydrolase [Acidobacteria bacterium]|nr:serine hydrolase [Acidobacteriota bacterium]
MKNKNRILVRSSLMVMLLISSNIFGIGQASATTAKSIDAATRTEVIEGAIKALNDTYVFPEVAAKMEQSIRERVARKEYDSVNDAGTFARLLTTQLQEISHDKHLRIMLSEGSRFSGPPQQQRDMAAKRNYGFEKAERISGNIGYIDLRGFEQAGLASDTATAAMNFLANTDALIFDLRQNGGGDPAMVAFLTSYLFDKRTHLNSIYSRPANSTQEFWTREDVPGKKYGNKPVYVLTSNYTFSAGEEFTYNLQSLKRATIIGETTGGGAHPVQPRQLGKLFTITVPFARSINPITKTNWEGVGVKPDVAVSADKALKTAHLVALKQIQPTVSDARLTEQLKGLIENLQKEVGEIALPVTTQAPIKSAMQQAPSTGKELTLPDTPAGKALGKFIKSLNSGNLATMKQFHKETGGDEGNAEQDFGFYQQSGGLTLHSVAKSSDYEITVLAQAKKDGRWLSFGIAVEQQAPHAVTDLRVQPTEAPGEKKSESQSEASTAKKSETEVLKDLPGWLDKQAAEDKFSGAVLIAKNGQPVFQKAVGLANKESKTPNRMDTKFNLGSINKIFTRIAITQLIEQGKLAWDDKLGKLLPDYPNKDAKEKVTLKHLVEMQSGIGDFFGPKFEAVPKTKIRSINDYLPLFANEALTFEPGTKRAYSNGGYIVLGAIIEKVTGKSYYDYVREHIFKPAGMTNTDAFFSDAKTPNLAEGYRLNEKGERVNNLDTRPARGSSAGGGYSTTEDLLKFSNALLANKLISVGNTKQIVGGGLGVAGGAPGINSELEIDPASGYTIVVMGNYDPPNAANVNRHIRSQLLNDN